MLPLLRRTTMDCLVYIVSVWARGSPGDTDPSRSATWQTFQGQLAAPISAVPVSYTQVAQHSPQNASLWDVCSEVWRHGVAYRATSLLWVQDTACFAAARHGRGPLSHGRTVNQAGRASTPSSSLSTGAWAS